MTRIVDYSYAIGNMVGEWLCGLPDKSRLAILEACRVPERATIKSIAAEAGVTRRQVQRHWEQASNGTTLGHLLLAAKLAKLAAYLLRQDHWPNQHALAELLGWSSPVSLRSAIRRAGYSSIERFSDALRNPSISDVLIHIHIQRVKTTKAAA